jgi:hypothetical protein
MNSDRYPASPPPLSDKDAYTTWPGGVDPTAKLYDSVGGKRKTRRSKNRKPRSRKNRKTLQRRR